jgi:hypothetical protein
MAVSQRTPHGLDMPYLPPRTMRQQRLCGAIYNAFVAAASEAARSGRHGRLRILPGAHDLYETNLQEVLAAIHEVASAAKVKYPG